MTFHHNWIFAQIRELREVIELPLTNPELFKRVGIKPPKVVATVLKQTALYNCILCSFAGRVVVWAPRHWKNATGARVGV